MLPEVSPTVWSKLKSGFSKSPDFSRQSVWLMVFTLLNLVASPVCLYFVFKDSNFLEFSSVPQICQDVITIALFIAGTISYLYLASWLFVPWFPVTVEMIMDQECFLLGPIAVSTWISLIQLKWTIFVTTFVFAYFLGGLLANIMSMEKCSLETPDALKICDGETVILIPNESEATSLAPDDIETGIAINTSTTDESEVILYERGDYCTDEKV